MKRTKLNNAKLTLSSETIRELASSSLSGVGGGYCIDTTYCTNLCMAWTQSGGSKCKTNV
jgi:hypothetical protein